MTDHSVNDIVEDIILHFWCTLFAIVISGAALGVVVPLAIHAYEWLTLGEIITEINLVEFGAILGIDQTTTGLKGLDKIINWLFEAYMPVVDASILLASFAIFAMILTYAVLRSRQTNRQWQ